MGKQAARLVGVMNDRTRPKVKTPEDVYAHMFGAIVDQRLLPGTKLNELALVAAFGIIPSFGDQYLCAQSRIPIEIMRHGWLMSLFQA